MPVESVRIRTRDGLALEGRLALPPAPRGGAIVCHPHPLYGGSMSSALVPAIQRALLSRGWAALRFNFRGVGRSEGAYGGGEGEGDDARAALGHVAAVVGDRPLAVCGWSFGALVGLAVAIDDARVTACALVAPPVSFSATGDLPPQPDPARLASWDGRLLAVCGTEDPFCRPKRLAAWLAGARAEVRVLEGADHFFTDARDDLASTVGNFVAGA